jgi:L-asparagine oxygenase
MLLNTKERWSDTPAFSKHIDAQGVLTVRCADWLHDQLEQEFGYLGYINANEDVFLSHLNLRLTQMIGPMGVKLLFDIANNRIGNGVVVITNLPFEQVNFAPEPGQPAHSAKRTSLSEHILLAFGQSFGEPYGVLDEGERLINDLIPSKADLERFTGNGSRAKLGLHAENIALKYAVPGIDLSPKYLMLTGVSAQHVGGPTTPVAIASEALKRLCYGQRAVLRSACVKIGLPVRQRTGMDEADEVGPISVVSGPEGWETISAAFYGDMMRPISVEAGWALDALQQALDDVAIHLKVLPGTLVYLSNGRVLHGRSDFEPVFDENGRAQRWLQRIFGTGRLDAFDSCKALSDRVFDVNLRDFTL